jgi:hypothetical protein
MTAPDLSRRSFLGASSLAAAGIKPSNTVGFSLAEFKNATAAAFGFEALVSGEADVLAGESELDRDLVEQGFLPGCGRCRVGVDVVPGQRRQPAVPACDRECVGAADPLRSGVGGGLLVPELVVERGDVVVRVGVCGKVDVHAVLHVAYVSIRQHT